MGYNFRAWDHDQLLLVPPSLRDWLPQDHLVWMILDTVDELNLDRFYQRRRDDGWGRPAFHPKMMVALLLYAYCTGVRSSRRIERACREDVAFRVLCANTIPDHTTVARFRADHQDDLKTLFVQILMLCAQAGLANVGLVALDGTKIGADAALRANRKWDALQAMEAELAAVVETMLAEAAAADRNQDRLFTNDSDSDDRERGRLPKPLATAVNRLERIRAAKDLLQTQAEARRAAWRQKMEQREVRRAEGEPVGRPPADPGDTPDPDAKANTTDPDSRIMKTAREYVQGYNAQAVVTQDQLIVAAELTCDQNDQAQLHPMIDATLRTLADAGIADPVKVVLADAGYCSAANLEAADPDGPTLLVSTGGERKQRNREPDSAPTQPRPAKPTARDKMTWLLDSPEGSQLYKIRSQTVEPVFGQIKTPRGITRFMRRGLAACESEWSLICSTHNLLKLHRYNKAT